MSDPTEPTIALWFQFDGNRVDFDLCYDLEEAADTAAFFLSGDSDHTYRILGLQFSDGRTVPASAWDIAATVAAYAAAAAERRAQPLRPVRHTWDPFTGTGVAVDSAEPAWLGDDGSQEGRDV
jgi:hypothetical protein